MLGALEVKAVNRLAALHAGEWKIIHTAVIDCILAHHNRRTGLCWPERKAIASHCNVSERTVDRAIAKLLAWGAIERLQPRSLASGQFRPRQFTFQFELPRDTQVSHGRETKSGVTVGQNEGCNKEEAKI